MASEGHHGRWKKENLPTKEAGHKAIYETNLGLEDKTVGEGTSCYDPAAGCSVGHKSGPNCMSCRAAQAGGTTEQWSARATSKKVLTMHEVSSVSDHGKINVSNAVAHV
ncbi:hypothetical protein E5D57_003156 [Metarhizium anisopliae]|nr:hypothetical protein E5D57_010577 [Metarhizium anisopliae]KAF5130109.1 hypothetical protein E5D57_006445 [Metarhizium anisopliae]KAF5139361.1 hypothetical protein E5D57_003156 [Metarhizium anisopliae]